MVLVTEAPCTSELPIPRQGEATATADLLNHILPQICQYLTPIELAACTAVARDWRKSCGQLLVAALSTYEVTLLRELASSALQRQYLGVAMYGIFRHADFMKHCWQSQSTYVENGGQSAKREVSVINFTSTLAAYGFNTGQSEAIMAIKPPIHVDAWIAAASTCRLQVTVELFLHEQGTAEAAALARTVDTSSSIGTAIRLATDQVQRAARCYLYYWSKTIHVNSSEWRHCEKTISNYPANVREVRVVISGATATKTRAQVRFALPPSSGLRKCTDGLAKC